MNRDDMITAMRALAAQLGTTTVARHQYLRETGLSQRQVLKEFGTYNGLVQAAGLKPSLFPGADGPTYTDEELLAEIVRVLRIPESKLTRIYFEQNASVSPSVCERRFGGWINAMRKAREFLDPTVDGDVLARIAEYADSAAPPARPMLQRTMADGPHEAPTQAVLADTERPTGPARFDTSNLYGDFVNFRGLQHAPVNEQGVVFLFGMICRELGYVVESVRSGFPDCEAKRQIQRTKGKWQRVRIEFEFESRSFRSHGHDPDQCDVIVCWEHNWPDCPIEVLELKGIMSRMPNGASS